MSVDRRLDDPQGHSVAGCDEENLYEFDIHGSVHRRLLSKDTNKMLLCNRIYYSKVY